MYALPTTRAMKDLYIHNREVVRKQRVVEQSHEDHVRQQLINLGVTKTGLMRSEARYLPKIIHPTETIGGVVYGRHPEGLAMLIATDKRVIYLNKNPLFTNMDEVTYDVVSGVRHSKAGLATTVTLHTRIKDYPIRSFNNRCASGFVHYIEDRRLEHAD